MARKKTDSPEVQEVQILNPEFVGGLIGASLVGAASSFVVKAAEKQEETNKIEKEEEEKKEGKICSK